MTTATATATRRRRGPRGGHVPRARASCRAGLDDLPLVRRARAGDAAAVAALLAFHEPFVVRLASRYAALNPGVGFEDLVSVGKAALVLDALPRYDFRPGVKFLSYAGHWVSRAIREAAHYSRLIRVPRTSLQMGFCLGDALRAKNVAFAGDDEQDVLGGLAAREGGDGYGPDEIDKLRRLLAELPDRDREVLHARYAEGRTLREIGERYGITKECVRQCEKKALAKLRERFAGELSA
jgi:RNA polymerase primary sigma factor